MSAGSRRTRRPQVNEGQASVDVLKLAKTDKAGIDDNDWSGFRNRKIEGLIPGHPVPT